MKNNLVLCLIAAGYSTRLGFPKHGIKLANGKYVFESIIDAIPSKYLYITTNQRDASWWDNWLQTTPFKNSKKVTILVEKHSTPEENKRGPLLSLTQEVVETYKNTNVKNVVISTIDSYFDNFSFVPSLLRHKNALVTNFVGLEEAKSKGVVYVDSKTDEVLKLVEKPTSIEDYGVGSSVLVFTSILKTTLANLARVGPLVTSNYGDIVPRLLETTKLRAILHNGLYYDTGIPSIYESLLRQGITLKSN